MLVNSTNQVRHLYVITDIALPGTLTKDTDVGTASVVTNNKTGDIYLQYVTDVGIVTKSEIINKNTVINASGSKSVKHKLDTYFFNLGGGMYDLDLRVNLEINNYNDLSPDNKTIIHLSGKTDKGLFGTQSFVRTAISLAKDAKRQGDRIQIYCIQNTHFSLIPVYFTDNINMSKYNNVKSDFTIITLKDTPYILGQSSSVSPKLVKGNVHCSMRDFPGGAIMSYYRPLQNLADWSPYKYPELEKGNGKKIADLEYFYKAERGDIYRNMGYPKTFDIKYLVDPSMNYDTIDITYSTSNGDNEDIQKSQRTLTLVFPDLNNHSAGKYFKQVLADAGIKIAENFI